MLGKIKDESRTLKCFHFTSISSKQIKQIESKEKMRERVLFSRTIVLFWLGFVTI